MNDLLGNCDSTETGGKIMGCTNNSEERRMVLRCPVIRRNKANHQHYVVAFIWDYPSLQELESKTLL